MWMKFGTPDPSVVAGITNPEGTLRRTVGARSRRGPVDTTTIAPAHETPVDPAYGDIGIVSATPVGPDAADFSVTSNSCSHFIYLSGGVGAGTGRITECSVTVQFTPSDVGPESADLAVAWKNAGGESGAQTWR